MARVPPDGCLVPTSPLAEILDRFFADWKRDRPPTGGQFAAGGATNEVGPVRAAQWLAAESGLSELTIQRIVDRRHRMTELRVADALVAALGHPELFYDGTPPTLVVSPNPAASALARAGCCGGSTPVLA